jgi:hypothetical protein
MGTEQQRNSLPGEIILVVCKRVIILTKQSSWNLSAPPQRETPGTGWGAYTTQGIDAAPYDKFTNFANLIYSNTQAEEWYKAHIKTGYDTRRCYLSLSHVYRRGTVSIRISPTIKSVLTYYSMSVKTRLSELYLRNLR